MAATGPEILIPGSGDVLELQPDHAPTRSSTLAAPVTASVLFVALAVSAWGVSNAGRFEYLEGLDYATVTYG